MAEIEEWRKRPVVVRMLRWMGGNEDELAAFTGGNFHVVDPCDRIEDLDVTGEVWDKLHSTWVGVKTGQLVVRSVLYGRWTVIVPPETAEPKESGS